MMPNKNPQKGEQTSVFPVVAIGASAGGLEALKLFFDNMPLKTGMAFVVITHQKYGNVSLLPEILQGHTLIPALEASDGITLEADHIYIAPSTGHLSVTDHRFILSPFEFTTNNHSTSHPIDYFFRSLAENFTQHAICVVLSGSGSDGSIGLKAINEHGGLVVIEDPEHAAFSGMPESGIATGLADYVLLPEQMPDMLLQYVDSIRSNLLRPPRAPKEIPDDRMNEIFALLRNQTGHDFSAYKTSTLYRRIERRMSLHQIHDYDNYIHYLKTNPQEIDLLFKELLIRVTNFFRDAEMWNSIAKTALINMLKDCPANGSLRMWVPGCATGEEAYNLAILIRETMDSLNKYVDVQIFATDLDAAAIDIARKGRYPDGISEDVSPERLKKYFVHQDGNYSIRKNIREMVVFATQNLIKDPPFTKVNLISCRNLLIYIKPELQKKVLSIFHYALLPKGVLVLGSSETIGNFSTFFDTIDKKNKIYQHKASTLKYHYSETTFPNAPSVKTENTVTYDLTGVKEKDKNSFTHNILKMLVDRFSPISIVINNVGEVYYIHGKTGDYFELSEGRPRNNLLDMAREGLRLGLSSALRTLSSDNHDSIHRAVKVKNNNGIVNVDFTLEKIQQPETLSGLLLMTLVPTDQTATSSVVEAPITPDSTVESIAFEQELEVARESYQTIVEELESSNEELKSTNEELQSTNEELQSTNEELETSKEELQSLNEELSTVNAELQSKLDELSQANDDMQNLLNSTDIATIFLDEKLYVKRFTEQASKLISLRHSDIGRPVIELSSSLIYDSLVEDGQEVLRTLKPKEIKLQTNEGNWYLMRILPYRTTENIINGLVCTFIDIEKIKLAERQGDFYRGVIDALETPLIVMNLDFKVCSANNAFYNLLQLTKSQVENMPLYDIDRGAWNVKVLRDALNNLVLTGNAFENTKLVANFYTSGEKKLILNGRKINPPNSKEELILITITDQT